MLHLTGSVSGLREFVDVSQGSFQFLDCGLFNSVLLLPLPVPKSIGKAYGWPQINTKLKLWL